MPCRMWVTDFLKRHKARFAPPDWPVGDDLRVWTEAWMEALDEIRATEVEADEASRHLKMGPPEYRRQHIPLIVTQIQAIRRSAADAGSPMPDSREAAVEASRNCPECDGAGATWRRFIGEDEQLYRFAFGCGCPYGRWLTDQRRADSKAPREVKGMPSLLDYPELIDPERRPVGCPRTTDRGTLPAIRRGGQTVAMKRWLRDGEENPSPAGSATPGQRKGMGVPQGPDVTERDWEARRSPRPTGTDGPPF
jgi:hypothetical protein